jgi:hypothetical protein
MRISLWQQFSSNHSSSYIVVGQFETQEWAEQVKLEVHSIVREISDWWDQHDDTQRKIILDELQRTHRLTPPEQTIQRRYQVNLWPPLAFRDWIGDEDTLEGIFQVGRLVFVVSGETWAGPQPFSEILRKLGGHVAEAIEEGDTYIVLNLRMIAPNEVAAQSLHTHITEDEEFEEPELRLAFPGVPSIRGVIHSEGVVVFIDDIDIWESYDLVIPSTEIPPDTSALMLTADTAEISLDFAEMFQRLLTFLQSQGMTAIEYHIAQKSYSEG